MSATLLSIGTVLSSLVLLWLGAEMLVRGASALALRAGVSALAVGLTVVAFGTSAPELVVSLDAAGRGASDIALGNVVGSNICNIALILGLSALLRPVVVERKVFRLDVPLLMLATLVLVVLLFLGGLTRWAGLSFVVALVVYTAATLVQARRATRSQPMGGADIDRSSSAGAASAAGGDPTDTATAFSQPGSGDTGGAGNAGGMPLQVLLLALGLGGLVWGGRLLVGAAVALAETFGVPQAVIGLTIVAIGTSLPELATSLVATWRRQSDLVVGNIVGSNLFNILCILGITAMVHPLQRGGIDTLDLGTMMVLTALMLPVLRSGAIVSRIEGAVLLASYVAYIWLRVI